MHHKRQSPMRWYVWMPPLLILLLVGLLVLEPQGPRTPAGHPMAQLVLALLIYGVLGIWLWCIRRALTNKEDKRAQQQERMHTVRQQQREPAMSTQEPWDDAFLPWRSNGDSTHVQRRR